MDVPMTISYTQKLYKHINKVNRPMKVTRNKGRTLFWL
jgi:hypothetical protein